MRRAILVIWFCCAPVLASAAAKPEWFVELRNGTDIVCNGAVTYLDPKKFQISTAGHCFGGFTIAATGPMGKTWDLKALSATRTDLRGTDFGIVDVPCSADCPKAAIPIGVGTPKWIYVSPANGSFSMISLSEPSAPEVVEFDDLCTDALCRKCGIRLKSSQPVVDSHSGAPVLTFDGKTLVGIVSTESRGSNVASFCAPVEAPSCDFETRACLVKLATKGFSEPRIFRFTDLFFDQWQKSRRDVFAKRDARPPGPK